VLVSVVDSVQWKQRKNMAQSTQFNFMPIATETLVAFSDEATTFFQDRGHRIREVIGRAPNIEVSLAEAESCCSTKAAQHACWEHNSRLVQKL
jgi:hypothetical protein